MTDLRMGATEWLLLLTLSLLWGGSFFFAEVALADLPPLTVVAGRVGIGALALLVLARLAGQPMPRQAGTWLALFVMGTLNNALPFSLIVWGQQHIESGLASILNATTPIFVVLVAHAATRDERLTPARGAGVLLGFTGAVLLIGPEALGGITSEGAGQLAVLGAAFSYACAGVFGRRLRQLSPVVAAAGMVGSGALLVVPAALIIDRPWSLAPGAGALGAVAGIALLSTAAAYVIYFRVLKSAGATNLLLVTFLIPASALALGIAFLGEEPPPAAFAGLALIFAGLAAIDGRLWARLRPRPCQAGPSTRRSC